MSALNRTSESELIETAAPVERDVDKDPPPRCTVQPFQGFAEDASEIYRRRCYWTFITGSSGKNVHGLANPTLNSERLPMRAYAVAARRTACSNRYSVLGAAEVRPEFSLRWLLTTATFSQLRLLSTSACSRTVFREANASRAFITPLRASTIASFSS